MGLQNLIQLTKRPNLFILKNKNEKLTGFGPTSSTFPLLTEGRFMRQHSFCKQRECLLGLNLITI